MWRLLSHWLQPQYIVSCGVATAMMLRIKRGAFLAYLNSPIRQHHRQQLHLHRIASPSTNFTALNLTLYCAKPNPLLRASARRATARTPRIRVLAGSRRLAGQHEHAEGEGAQPMAGCSSDGQAKARSGATALAAKTAPQKTWAK
jgi:hypothetical protein